MGVVGEGKESHLSKTYLITTQREILMEREILMDIERIVCKKCRQMRNGIINK